MGLGGGGHTRFQSCSMRLVFESSRGDLVEEGLSTAQGSWAGGKCCPGDGFGARRNRVPALGEGKTGSRACAESLLVFSFSHWERVPVRWEVWSGSNVWCPKFLAVAGLTGAGGGVQKNSSDRVQGPPFVQLWCTGKLGYGIRRTEYKAQLTYSLTVWSRISYLTSLCLSFLISENWRWYMKTMIQGCCQDGRANTVNTSFHVSGCTTSPGNWTVKKELRLWDLTELGLNAHFALW